jgi:hypothetical protein
MLFTPGARLGWIFRDRRTLLAPYPEPEPDLEQLREQAAAGAAAAQARYARARRWAGKPSLIAAVVLVLLAGCARAVGSGADTGRTLLTVLVLCAPGLTYAVAGPLVRAAVRRGAHGGHPRRHARRSPR